MATHTHLKLNGELRSTLGKQVRQLRRNGKTPGVIYGPAIAAPQPVTVDEHELSQTYHRTGQSALVDLTVDGQTYPVFIRGIQIEPIRRGLLSVEFYAPEMNQPVTATVPVVTVGELASTVDGVLTHTRETVDVRGLPDEVPQYLEADISGLDAIDAAVTVADLRRPAGIEVLTPAEEIVVKVAAPAPVELPPSPEEVLAEETGDMPAAVNEGAEPVEEPGS